MMAKERNAPMSVAIHSEDVPEHVERLKQRGFVIDEISDQIGDRLLQSE